MRVGILISMIFWGVVAVVLSSCSFGMYFDPLEDGSETTASYKRNTYQNISKGMDFSARSKEAPTSEPLAEQQPENRPWFK